MKKELKVKVKIVKVLIAVICVLSLGILAISFFGKDNNQISSDLYPKDMESMVIKTTYCNLYYPKKWQKTLNSKVVAEENREVIHFFAEIEGKKEVQIFDIMFGGEGYEVGVLQTKNGHEIVVNMGFYELEFDNTWSESEKEIVTIMQEDINYLLLELEELSSFTPSR